MASQIKLKISLSGIEKKNQTSRKIPAPKMEFHIAKKVRDKYQFDDEIFTLNGNVILANFHAVRMFAHKVNQKRDLEKNPEEAIRPGQLNALGLIDEILHYVLYVYRQDENPDVLKNTLNMLYEREGQEDVDRALYQFAEEFPPVAVYQNNINLDIYFEGITDGVPNKEIIFEEMVMLWISNMNPACKPYAEFFDDSTLVKHTCYLKMLEHFHEFLDSQPTYGPDNQNILDMLRSPAIAHPHSLKDQLDYIKRKWGMILGKFLLRLLSGFDLIREEDKMRGFGKPTNEVYDYSGYDFEYERFSADREWMPKVVLIAKSTLVWLDQLSKDYKQSITRLDQIPDEELDKLASYGFTGLWLIGLWERSHASKVIKQSCGNPDAESSAYSLYDYIIAGELGGEEALLNLKERCWRRGIRVASDMVPNHTGIDSKWVHEHPDWYVQLPHTPFPAYSFNSQNLSTNPGIGIYMEDHYYNKSDASVVFKRVDFGSGETRYIYHGNDGTHMPWNDTAQLNFLNVEVREAVIQTILHVARMFPIIRFDAAMTLAKKHFQRLWYPIPGSGGDIPSRSEHGMTKPQFDEVFPVEFWREVVDRVAEEVPDTLLLAEAFWLMEGYFVRTLGMHRVYNSAFMNMLKTEDNQKYRYTIKNTIEFDPEILKRFVNFMNNPDEDTAVAQFGKGDKYFGACLSMVTMPGLPMFGHAQIEGFTEKYGMEYRKAYWDETPDEELIKRHEREIFPLMKKRHIFSGVKNFLLYDLYTPEGWVNENVFAYTNRAGMDRGLVFYNNKYDFARGWIHTSSAYADKNGGSENKQLVQKCLGEGLLLPNDSSYYCVFRDSITGLEYIRNCKEVWDKGIYVELQAFQYHAFLDFREVCDNEYGHYGQICGMLQGGGVPSIEEKLKELMLKPLYDALFQILNIDVYQELLDESSLYSKKESAVIGQLEDRILNFFTVIKDFYTTNGDVSEATGSVLKKLAVIKNVLFFDKVYNLEAKKNLKAPLKFMTDSLKEEKFIITTLYTWGFLHLTGLAYGKKDVEIQSRSWIDEWFLGNKLGNIFAELELDGRDAWESVQLTRILTTHHNWTKSEKDIEDIIEDMFKDQDVMSYIQVNSYQGISYFNKEKFDSLLWWLYVAAFINTATDKKEKLEDFMVKTHKTIKTINKAKEASSYQVNQLLENLKK